jgi:Holliday junction resolvase
MTTTDVGLNAPQQLYAGMIYQALEAMGWQGDKDELVNRIERMRLGLPAEDEFATVITWLGRCRLVHRLDQFQIPPESKSRYQVPDLLAIFDVNGHDTPVLIEVKTGDKTKLAWPSAYWNELYAYGRSLGLPVLVAWKSRGMWTLCEISHFRECEKQHRLPLGKAMQENLLGVLAGDFGYVMQTGVGLTIQASKEELLAVEPEPTGARTEHWRLVIREAYYSNKYGRRTNKLPAGLWPLFLAGEMETVDEITDSEIVQRFVIAKDAGIQFASRALGALVAFAMPDGETVSWRKVMESGGPPVSPSEIMRNAIRKGIKLGYGRYGLDLVPQTHPEFLQKLGNGPTDGG